MQNMKIHPQNTLILALDTEQICAFSTGYHKPVAPLTGGAKQYKLRAYAHPEQNNQQIAQAVGITDRTVRK